MLCECLHLTVYSWFINMRLYSFKKWPSPLYSAKSWIFKIQENLTWNLINKQILNRLRIESFSSKLSNFEYRSRQWTWTQYDTSMYCGESRSINYNICDLKQSPTAFMPCSTLVQTWSSLVPQSQVLRIPSHKSDSSIGTSFEKYLSPDLLAHKGYHKTHVKEF